MIEVLEAMLKSTNDKEEIMSLFEEILKQKVKDYKYISTEKFNSITEYDFSLAKVNITFCNNEQKNIYIRMIKGGMIKESIFCYWSLLYEKYLDCNKSSMPNKVTITEKNLEKNQKNIILTIDKDLNYYTEICLVEIKKVIERKIKKNNKFKSLIEYFNNNEKDILFLGII